MTRLIERQAVLHAVHPYSGWYPLPLRNRSEEGVQARIADTERKYGPMENLHVEESPVYNVLQRRGWIALVLWADFGGVRVGLYGCDEGAYCDVAEADAFRRSAEEGLQCSTRDRYLS